LDSSKPPVHPGAPLDSSKPPVHPGAPLDYPSHRPPQYFLDSTKPPAIPILLGFNQATGHPGTHPSHWSTPVLPWTQPSHRSTPMLLWTHPSHWSTPVLSWTHPSHRSTPMLPWTIQATSPPRCSFGLSRPLVHPCAPLDSSKPLVHPSAPLDYPSHWFTPVGIVLLHCTRLQCSLHFCAYTLAMQSMVSTFIQHPSTYPSRYIIIQYRFYNGMRYRCFTTKYTLYSFKSTVGFQILSETCYFKLFPKLYN
jgi:hypothetical protein